MLRGVVLMFVIWVAGLGILRVTLVPAQVCPPVDSAAALNSVHAAVDWAARAQQPDGSFVYEWNANTDVESSAYNATRHAGLAMSLYMLAASGDMSGLQTADRAMDWMVAHLYRHADWAALRDPFDGSIETGGTGLMLAGLEHRRLATGDQRYDGLMHELAGFLLAMQQPDGSILLAWDEAAGAPNPVERSPYATGEAFWALTLMRRLFPAEQWEAPSRAVADYLSTSRDRVEHQLFPPWNDQWAAYGLAEMAGWPLSDTNIAYARTLAERFGFFVRFESGRRHAWWSNRLRGPRARSAGMGTWVEGLDSLWRLASKDPRMRDMRDAIAERAACSVGMLVDRQVSAEGAKSYPRPGLAQGAGFSDGVTRMDDQQHAIGGLLRVTDILDARKSSK